MRTNVYNIIWADDEIDDILSEEREARLQTNGITIIGKAHDGQELEELLDANAGMVDAVIVDANFNESSIEIMNERDTSGLDYARSLYIHKVDRKIPFFLFTNRSDELLKEIYQSNPKFLEDFPRHKRWFSKSGQDEYKEMLQSIKDTVDAQDSPEFRVRNKYQYELNAAVLLDGAYDYFFEVMLRNELGTLAEMREPFISVRRIVEKGFDFARALALIPPITDDTNGTAAYLFHDCYKKDGAVLYKKDDLDIIPKPVAASLRYIVNITQDSAHSRDDLKLKVDEYFAQTKDCLLLMSVVYAAMEFVKWLAMTAMSHKDPEANQYMLWSEVSHEEKETDVTPEVEPEQTQTQNEG